jgi:hypothetical protein
MKINEGRKNQASGEMATITPIESFRLQVQFLSDCKPEDIAAIESHARRWFLAFIEEPSPGEFGEFWTFLVKIGFSIRVKSDKALAKKIERERKADEDGQNIVVQRSRRGQCRSAFHKHELIHLIARSCADLPTVYIIEAVNSLLVEVGFHVLDYSCPIDSQFKRLDVSLERSFRDWSAMDLPGFPRAASTLGSKKLANGKTLIHLKPKKVSDPNTLPTGSV